MTDDEAESFANLLMMWEGKLQRRHDESAVEERYVLLVGNFLTFRV